MWTYRIDDADNDSVIDISAIFVQEDQILLKVIGKKVATGTVYVIVDSTGAEQAWMPITTDKHTLGSYCRMQGN